LVLPVCAQEKASAEKPAGAKTESQDAHEHDHAAAPAPQHILPNGQKVTPLANTNKVVFTNLTQKASYVMGIMAAANVLMDAEEVVQPEMVLMGVRDVLYHYIPLVSQEEADSIRKEFDREMLKYQEEKKVREAENNKKAGEAFLAENKKKEGVVTTPSGLQYKISNEGSGNSPSENDKVAIHFRSKTVDGVEFANSYKHKEPSVTPLRYLPKGLQEALLKMKPGSKWELFVPSDLAYGNREVAKGVGPNSTIIFELELVRVEK
jgi:FKBP-type peptidyl-prolyl cis-trans isomerase FklB